MRWMFSLTVAAALLLAPLNAMAVTAAKSVTYHTSYRQIHPMPEGGAVTGRMTLSFSKDGTVTGTYRDEFQGGTHSVAGGLHDASLWLSIGSQGRRQFKGTIRKDGTISGTLSNWRGPNVYQFTAVPAS